MATFTTPVRSYQYGQMSPLWWPYNHEGLWVCKTKTGEWRNVVCPSQQFLNDCEIAYQGGLVHSITDQQAQELTSAGYGEYVSA